MNECSILEILQDSDAFKEIQRIVKDKDTYCIRLYVDENGIKVKRNSGMWSVSLKSN